MTLIVESGQTTGQIDLLSKLADFITNDVGAPWSVQSFGSVGQVPGYPLDRQLSLYMNNTGSAPYGDRKGYFHLISQLSDSNPRLYFAPSFNYTGATTAWNAQSGGLGGSNSMGISIPKTASSPPMNYWFFCESHYLWIVVEIDGGWFQHAFMGAILAADPNIISGVNQGLYCAGTIQWGQRTSVNQNYNVLLGGLVAPSSGFQGLIRGGETPMGVMGEKPGGNTSSPEDGSAILRDATGTWRKIGRYERFSDAAPSGEGYRSFDCASDGLTVRAAVGSRPPGQFDANIVSALNACMVTVVHPTASGKFYEFGLIPGAYVTSTRGLAEATTIEIDGDWYTIFPLLRTRRSNHFFMNAGIAIKTVAPA